MVVPAFLLTVNFKCHLYSLACGSVLHLQIQYGCVESFLHLISDLISLWLSFSASLTLVRYISLLLKVQVIRFGQPNQSKISPITGSITLIYLQSPLCVSFYGCCNKFGKLIEHRFIFLQFWRSEVLKSRWQ